MKDLEIRMPVINNSPDEIKKGMPCYIEKKLHIYLFGKFRKYRWYHKLFFKPPATVGHIKNIDTSQFHEGDLYLDPNNPGGFTQ